MTNDNLYKSIFMSKPFEFKYDEFILEVTVRKRESDHYVKCSYHKPGDFKKAYRSIFNFFNEIVWFYQTKLSDVNGIHSQGSHVGLNYKIQDEGYLLRFEQQISNQRQHLGLAFYREAQCNESPYYRFFCFNKILEMPFEKGKGKKEWLEGALINLKTELAQNARNQLSKQIRDKSLAQWLYETGRHGIAHAHLNEFTRDPNNFVDWEEIKWANVIMQEIAEATLVQKLKIENYP